MNFQQDGASPHHRAILPQYLIQKLPKGWVGRGGRIWSPSRSWDLPPSLYFLKTFLKDTVSRELTVTIPELKDLITLAVNKIVEDILRNVYESIKIGYDLYSENKVTISNISQTENLIYIDHNIYQQSQQM